MYDVVIIGAGIVGAMTARALSKYRLSVCVLEKENDVAMGATKANSAIVHAGFDAKEGSLKAKLNVRGSEMMERIAAELGVSYRKNGSLVIAFDKEDEEMLRILYHRGVANGVRDLELLDAGQLKEKEPNLSDRAVGALYAPTGAIVCPYELAIAAIGNAMDNGVELKRNFEVTQITRTDEGFLIASERESVSARFIINAAGMFSDAIAALVGDHSFRIRPRKGEYLLLDRECGELVSSTIFRTPSKAGKGILLSPTVDGNLIAGPTSVDLTDKEDLSTTAQGLSRIIAETTENCPRVPFGRVITSFCGSRAVGSTGDFILTSPTEHFINAAGIESPGLSASPAIAEYLVGMLRDMGLELRENEQYCPIRKPMYFFRNASDEEKNEIIRRDKTFGHVICRCETVTEGELLYALRTNPKATDLDGLKRRTRAQMGRCQGGFCIPYLTELIAKELGIPQEQVTKCGGDSRIVLSKTKEAKA